MTQEEKELLSKDLCVRLKYGTICEDIYGNSGILFDLVPELNSVTLKISELGSTWTTDIDKVKPYLRPMSSMTEEEREEFRAVGGVMSYSPQHDTWAISAFAPEAYDWLNEHHFDYRGLISMGLALKATEDMYKN